MASPTEPPRPDSGRSLIYTQLWRSRQKMRVVGVREGFTDSGRGPYRNLSPASWDQMKEKNYILVPICWSVALFETYNRKRRMIMNPVGGSPGRRLRGSPHAGQWVCVTCTCGQQYKIPVTAILDRTRCPNKKCRKETRTLPVVE